MTINEHLSWTEVGAISTGGDNHVRNAFKGGQADKVLLTTGFELYKFNEYNSLAPPDAPTISPWWSPFRDYKHDGGWEQRKKLAAHLGKHPGVRTGNVGSEGELELNVLSADNYPELQHIRVLWWFFADGPD